MKLSKEIKNELKSFLKNRLSHKEERATLIAPYQFSSREVTQIQNKIPLIAELPVDVVIDESIMAGFMIKVGSKLIDCSLKTKVKDLF